jgi:hypothetical protein
MIVPDRLNGGVRGYVGALRWPQEEPGRWGTESECVSMVDMPRCFPLQVLLVCVGIALRGAAFSVPRGGSGGAGGQGSGAGQWWGIAAMLASALGYSTMGVLYDLLVRTEQPAPSHLEVMHYTSRLGAHLSSPPMRPTALVSLQ